MRKSSFVMMLASAAALGLGGCNSSGVAGGSANADSIKQTIKADEAKWNQQFKARDTEALVGHYADNAFFAGPGVAGTEGSTPIRQVYADASTDPAFEVHFASDKIDVAKSGDMAYARGKFSEKYTDKKTGKVMTDSGSYITVYEKQDDGSWKAVEDFAAADPDSTKPVAPEKPAQRAKMVSF
jgi:ketosteroid isomerase-like protein